MDRRVRPPYEAFSRAGLARRFFDRARSDARLPPQRQPRAPLVRADVREAHARSRTQRAAAGRHHRRRSAAVLRRRGACARRAPRLEARHRLPRPLARAVRQRGAPRPSPARAPGNEAVACDSEEKRPCGVACHRRRGAIPRGARGRRCAQRDHDSDRCRRDRGSRSARSSREADPRLRRHARRALRPRFHIRRGARHGCQRRRRRARSRGGAAAPRCSSERPIPRRRPPGGAAAPLCGCRRRPRAVRGRFDGGDASEGLRLPGRGPAGRHFARWRLPGDTLRGRERRFASRCDSARA